VERLELTDWEPQVSLPKPRSNFVCAEMSNSIYLIGGNSLGRVKSSVLKFDGEKWTKIFQMASHLKDMGIFPTCNTEVIVYGGVDNN